MWIAGRVAAGAAGFTPDARGLRYTGPATGVTFRVEPEGDGWRLVLPVPCSEVHLVEALEVLLLDGADPAVSEAFSVVNEVAHRMVVSGVVRALPRATNRAIWTWNRQRRAYGDRLVSVENVACAPARVQWVAPAGDPAAVLTAASWSQLLPIALPEVDLVFVTLDHHTLAVPQIALRPWLERSIRRGADHEFGRSGVAYRCGLGHWLFDEDPPDDLIDLVRTVGSDRPFVRLGAADVLDRETVREARASIGAAVTLPPAPPRL